MDKDRREHPRYRVSNEALAILKPHPIKLGQIINISEGGLAFQYLGEDKINAQYIELDIFVSKNGKQFNAFPFSKVRDFQISSQFEKSTPIRQLCVKFDDLSVEQKSLLKNFINEYAA